ncbi:hypothetical protein AXF42_Ash021518 [Apostasia shenzhenica]|uniref:Uncharacterized protein n=1 Tax=Apostasia shenzhenica TaxID=1088818 RepID=A0A2H9ZSV1_9ASPA|nr:hypothetical protein AXF42_Ash021518 [Apostasia shenzhenica]
MRAGRIAVAMWNALHAPQTAIALKHILGVWEKKGNGVSYIRVLADVLVVKFSTAAEGVMFPTVNVKTATAEMYFNIMENQLLIYQTVRESGSFRALPLHYYNRA